VLWQEGLPSQSDGNWDVLNVASPGKFWTVPIKIQGKFMTDPGPRAILSPVIEGAAIRFLNVNEKACH
jgi:hypothetical protein